MAKTKKKEGNKCQEKKENWAVLPNFPTHFRFMHKTPLCIFIFPSAEKIKFKVYSRTAEGHVKWHEKSWVKTILKLLELFLRKKKLKSFCWDCLKHTVGLPWNKTPMQRLGNSKLHHFYSSPDLQLVILITLKDTSGSQSKWFHKKWFREQYRLSQ